MSDRDWILFLNDIKKSIDKILRFTKELSKTQFIHDDKTCDAVLRNLEIIGEAIKNIPDEIKKDNSFIQ